MSLAIIPEEAALMEFKPTETNYIRPPKAIKIPGYDPFKAETNLSENLEHRSHPPHSLEHRKGVAYLINSVIIVLISAFLFISLFAWAEVIKSYIDSVIVSSEYKKYSKSKLVFAIVITVISIVMIILFYKLYTIEQDKYLSLDKK